MRLLRGWLGAGIVMGMLAGCGGGSIKEGMPDDLTAGPMPSMDAGKDALKNPSAAPAKSGGPVLAK